MKSSAVCDTVSLMSQNQQEQPYIIEGTESQKGNQNICAEMQEDADGVGWVWADGMDCLCMSNVGQISESENLKLRLLRIIEQSLSAGK